MTRTALAHPLATGEKPQVRDVNRAGAGSARTASEAVCPSR